VVVEFRWRRGGDTSVHGGGAGHQGRPKRRRRGRRGATLGVEERGAEGQVWRCSSEKARLQQGQGAVTGAQGVEEHCWGARRRLRAAALGRRVGRAGAGVARQQEEELGAAEAVGRRGRRATAALWGRCVAGDRGNRGAREAT
jgi:hypothetical protein